MMQGLLDDPRPLDVGAEPGKPMFLSCPGIPLQTKPGWTPPQIPVVLVGVLPSNPSGNSWYSQFSGPGILDDLGFFSILPPRKKSDEKSDVFRLGKELLN